MKNKNEMLMSSGFALEATLLVALAYEARAIPTALALVSAALLALIAALFGMLRADRERERAVREMREANERARHNEELFRRSFDDAAIGMAIAGLDGNWTKVNAAMCALLGYQNEELIGLGFERVTHPDDVDLTRHWLKRIRREACAPLRLEKRYLHRTGRVLWVDVTVSAALDPNGHPMHLVAQIQDVSARRAAEDSLLAAHASLLDAQSLAGIGNWETDLSGAAATWSDEMFRIFGLDWERGAPDWHNLPSLVEISEMPLVLAGLASCGERGASFERDLTVRRPDKSARYVHMVCRPRLDVNGSPVGLYGAVVDITDRKTAELRTEQHVREIADFNVVLQYQQEQLEIANAQLAALATQDHLTGLKNRAAFDLKLSEEFARSARYGSDLGLVLLDVDHFKSFNDTFGHQAGDRALRHIAYSTPK